MRIAARLAGKTIDHRQPQPRALANRLGSKERIEHLLQRRFGNTGAFVADFDADRILVTRQRNGRTLRIDAPGADGRRLAKQPPGRGLTLLANAMAKLT